VLQRALLALLGGSLLITIIFQGESRGGKIEKSITVEDDDVEFWADNWYNFDKERNIYLYEVSPELHEFLQKLRRKRLT
jgi:hypothetical protein